MKMSKLLREQAVVYLNRQQYTVFAHCEDGTII